MIIFAAVGKLQHHQQIVKEKRKQLRLDPLCELSALLRAVKQARIKRRRARFDLAGKRPGILPAAAGGDLVIHRVVTCVAARLADERENEPLHPRRQRPAARRILERSRNPVRDAHRGRHDRHAPSAARPRQRRAHAVDEAHSPEDKIRLRDSPQPLPSPAPHAEILAVAKEILAAKDVTLDIQEYSDYVIPNNVVEDGTVLANYFQHTPYLDDFNAQNGTHLVSVLSVHVEPLGLYGGKQSSLDALK